MPFFPENPGSRPYSPYPGPYQPYDRRYPPYQGSYRPYGGGRPYRPYPGPYQPYGRPYPPNPMSPYRNPGPGPGSGFFTQGINPFSSQGGPYQQRPGTWGNISQIMTNVGDLSNGINALRQMGSFFNILR